MRYGFPRQIPHYLAGRTHRPQPRLCGSMGRSRTTYRGSTAEILFLESRAPPIGSLRDQLSRDFLRWKLADSAAPIRAPTSMQVKTPYRPRSNCRRSVTIRYCGRLFGVDRFPGRWGAEGWLWRASPRIGIRANHVGAAIARHKRASERDGKLYAAVGSL
jgi:transposase